MRWHVSHRADTFAAALADKHYSRQKVGAQQFVPPGRCAVFYGERYKRGTAWPVTGRAYWVTSWPFAAFTKHEWAGAWICSAFRNEGLGLSSELVREAAAANVMLDVEHRSFGFSTVMNVVYAV